MNIRRREYIKMCLGIIASYSSRNVFAIDSASSIEYENLGNFQYIYLNKELRDSFLDFYTNVFHLYPENDLHDLITQLSIKYDNDQDIYTALQSSIKKIKPFFSDFTYALPALAKQKRVMTLQTLQLLDPNKRYEGYMELGTTGRYLSQLEDVLDIEGQRFLLHTTEAGYGPLDIIDRGQLTQIGQFVEMGQYSTEFTNTIEKNSLDLITVYIGFHHCPINIREKFISAIRDVLRPGGQLILRDHDAKNENLRRVAALAHDTFNAGTKELWSTNHKEERNFYSQKFITAYLNKLGLRYNGTALYQKGDPTKNGLMAFTKI